MTQFDELLPCANPCSDATTAEQLNRECHCITVDPLAMKRELEQTLALHGPPMDLAESHAHLFSGTPVFVSSSQLERMDRVVAAVEEVTALRGYQSEVLSWAPQIAAFDPGSPGGLLGLDFHLDGGEPRLIEINTNPGGAMINLLAVDALRPCGRALASASRNTASLEVGIIDAMLAEWRMQRGTPQPGFIAIIDDAPGEQYLYPEFVLYREMFRRHGIQAGIGSPADLVERNGRLYLGEELVDMVYNRLTDFDLQRSANAVLRDAYLDRIVVLSPHPRAHALLSDKRNMAVLGNAALLGRAGASPESIHALRAAVPLTELVTGANRDALWADRRHRYFKPAGSFGGKAGYRGDKLTRRVWGEIGKGTYVAQRLVTPSERHLEAGGEPMKLDIRCYAYRGRALLYAARLYRGQATNFRTPGGGFAPVLTRITG